MKRVMKVLAIVTVMLAMCSLAYCADGIGVNFPESGNAISEITTSANNIWATVIAIVQILAFAAIIFAGLRYMFASADAKGAIKGQTVGLVVGAALVFASPTIVKFIQSVVEKAL